MALRPCFTTLVAMGLSVLGATLMIASSCQPKGDNTEAVSVAPPQAGPAASSTPREPLPASPTSPTESATKTITVKELVERNKPGRYVVDVWVIELQPCPECGPHVFCKPCMGPKVVVSDEPNPPASSPRPPWRVPEALFGGLETGKRYRLEIDAQPTDYVPVRINRVVVGKVTPLP